MPDFFLVPRYKEDCTLLTRTSFLSLNVYSSYLDIARLYLHLKRKRPGETLHCPLGLVEVRCFVCSHESCEASSSALPLSISLSGSPLGEFSHCMYLKGVTWPK